MALVLILVKIRSVLVRGPGFYRSSSQFTGLVSVGWLWLVFCFFRGNPIQVSGERWAGLESHPSVSVM